jgi:PAS domain S-box-containing protein
MKLRTLTSLGLMTVMISLAGLVAYGLTAWKGLTEHVDQIAELEQKDRRLYQMGAAIDYMTLVRFDPLIIEALVDDADELSLTLLPMEHRESRLAANHLDELAYMGKFLLETATNGEAAANSKALLMLSRQIRIHHAGAREAVDILLMDLNDSQMQSLYRSIRTFVLASAGLGLLMLISALIIHRRFLHPIRTIDAGLRSLSRGELGARIRLDRGDEFGDLARSFNQMAEHRQLHVTELEESEARFRQIADNIGEVFWLAIPDLGKPLYLSPAYEEVWGRSVQSAFEGSTAWTDCIHPGDRQPIIDSISRRLDGDFLAEYRIVRPDGEVRWIQDRSFPIVDKQGEVIRIAGVARDITERRNYQSQLNERIKELRCLYQVLELTTSSELEVEEVAQRIVELLPESLQHESEAAACIFHEGKSFTCPNWDEPVAVIESDIRIDDQVVGRVMAGYCVAPDGATPDQDLFIPEEQALLNGIAVHFSRMIKQRRLMESLARSERLKAVGELTGGMAHDFNNLLTVIIGNADLLHEQLGEEKHPLAGLAEMVRTAGERGADLTQRMLAFARRQALEPKVVDINDLIGGMKGLLQRTLGEDVELQLEIDRRELPALVDAAQIESALLNLCLNSRDAMPAGGRLTVETEPVYLDGTYTSQFGDVEPGHYVLIAVSDTGNGMSPETIERAFEPFYTTKDHGTGLGLSMVFGLVKQLQGHIRIYSELDQGTTIRIYLPVGDGNDPQATDTEAEPHRLYGDETILLVEDNDLVREYAREQLVGLGYEVLEASNGQEALKITDERDDIDLLFTDVVMPGGMNGRQLADEIKKIRPAMKILYTSGYTKNAIVHHGRLDAGVELLAKPYHRLELARRIRKVLDQ